MRQQRHPGDNRALRRKHLSLTVDDILRSCPEFNSPTNRRYRQTDVSTFNRLFPDEDCCHFVSDPRRRWISKVRRCSAVFPNSECQPNSYTYTYGNADSNRNRQPDTYSNAHTCCHSAPAVWPAHFALTRPPGSGCAARFPNCYPSAARVALRLKFSRSQEIKSPPRRIPRRA